MSSGKGSDGKEKEDGYRGVIEESLHRTCEKSEKTCQKGCTGKKINTETLSH